MKKLYKNSDIEIWSSDRLKRFDYDNFRIMQIEQIGENLYAVEILSNKSCTDRVYYLN